MESALFSPKETSGLFLFSNGLGLVFRGYEVQGTQGRRRGDRVQHRGEGIGYHTGDNEYGYNTGGKGKGPTQGTRDRA